ncbi:MAG: flagellar assembly protein FliH [Spirochaetaceae bacterium]|nr:flagellar assembly protein FliH [Spirochaetaceae bacterium]
MAKAVFRPGEIVQSVSKVILEPPFPEEKKEEFFDIEEDENEEIFLAPTPAELQAEADRRKAEWETERATLLNAAKAEAENIVENAKRTVEEQAAGAKNEADNMLENARKDAEQIKSGAQTQAKEIEDAAGSKCESARKTAYDEGFEKGREEGYSAGFAEVQRLVTRAHVILERIQDKRSDILDEAEQQIIDLSLLVSRKVVKTIPETCRTVVVENIKEALARVKCRGKIMIKVNLADLELATERLAEFTKLVEDSGSMQILEDTSVDPGGCVIETDFGEIDARIANQLAELEARILEISPVKRNSR